MTTAEVAGPAGSWIANTDGALGRTWLPVAWANEVGAQPFRTWLLGRPFVVFRDDRGPVVLPDRCPHRLAPLSAGSVVEGRIRCAYHGWSFDGSGRCTAIPSLAGATRIPPRAHLRAPFGVKERYGIVFVALEQPVADVIELRSSGDPATSHVVTKDLEGRFGAALLIDNQLDTSHFAFVHRSTFGTEKAARVPRYEVERDADGWGFSYSTAVPIAAENDPVLPLGGRSLGHHRTMRYRVRAALQLSLEIGYPETGGSNSIGFFVQPQRVDQSRLFVRSVLAQPGGFSAAELVARRAFEERIGAEDRAIQGAFDVLAVPLDLSAECHVTADRAGVEYRRMLGRLLPESGDDHSQSPSDGRGGMQDRRTRKEAMVQTC